MPTVALFSFRQAELFFLGGAEAPPAPLGRTPVSSSRHCQPEEVPSKRPSLCTVIVTLQTLRMLISSSS